MLFITTTVHILVRKETAPLPASGKPRDIGDGKKSYNGYRLKRLKSFAHHYRLFLYILLIRKQVYLIDSVLVICMTVCSRVLPTLFSSFKNKEHVNLLKISKIDVSH